MIKHNAIAAYTIIFLKYGQQYLLLRRADSKQFAAGRWTGIGGRVETDELDDLQASATRELLEETGISMDDLQHFTLRRVLMHDRPGGALVLLLYFTAELLALQTPDCSEGTLHWRSIDTFDALDIIETCRPVLPLLIEDMKCDILGSEPVIMGLAHYRSFEEIAPLIWV